MEEAADQFEAFVVCDMRGGLLTKRLAIEVVGDVGFNDGWCYGCADGYGVDGHCVLDLVQNQLRAEGNT